MRRPTATTNDKGKIESSQAKYNEYDTATWLNAYFDEATGGYLVVDVERERHSHINKNERAIYEKEYAMSKVFARNGYRIEMLSETSRISSYDANINGIPADLKRISGENNIVKSASKAIHKQHAKVVLFQFDKQSERVFLELLKLRRRKYNVYYFFTGEDIVYKL